MHFFPSMKKKLRVVRSGKRMKRNSLCIAIAHMLVSTVYAAPKIQEQLVAPDNSPQGVLSQWHAFGSGCRASSEKPGKFKVNGKFEKTSLTLQFEPHAFELALKKGLKGVRECALRLSIDPPDSHKIKTIRARALLEATKSDGDRLRSRILLLLGDSLIGRREWDIQKSEFAKRRSEETVILPNPASMNFFKQTQCGETQIVGLDFTFEGVRHESPDLEPLNTDKSMPKRRGLHDEETKLRLKPTHPAIIEIIFEKCDN